MTLQYSINGGEVLQDEMVRDGSGYFVSYYMDETPELLESWKKQKFNELFLRALKLLEKNKDIPDNIKKCVIDMAKQIENKG